MRKDYMKIYHMAFKGDYMALWFGNTLVAIGQWNVGLLPLEQAGALGLADGKPNLSSKLTAKNDDEATAKFLAWIMVLAREVA